jgi:hypothetical protein
VRSRQLSIADGSTQFHSLGFCRRIAHGSILGQAPNVRNGSVADRRLWVGSGRRLFDHVQANRRSIREVFDSAETGQR